MSVLRMVESWYRQKGILIKYIWGQMLFQKVYKKGDSLSEFQKNIQTHNPNPCSPRSHHHTNLFIAYQPIRRLDQKRFLLNKTFLASMRVTVVGIDYLIQCPLPEATPSNTFERKLQEICHKEGYNACGYFRNIPFSTWFESRWERGEDEEVILQKLIPTKLKVRPWMKKGLVFMIHDSVSWCAGDVSGEVWSLEFLG